jgi:hypothetical protein
MSILLDRCSSHLVGASVVTEVNDFTTHRLEDSTEDSDCRIVTVEDRRCGNHAQRRSGLGSRLLRRRISGLNLARHTTATQESQMKATTLFNL